MIKLMYNGYVNNSIHSGYVFRGNMVGGCFVC